MTPTTNPTSPFATAAARAEHVARGVAETHPIFVARAEGARVWDTEGTRVPRLHRRHRRPEHRPSSSAGDGGGAPAARRLHAHLLPGGQLRRLRRAGGAAEPLVGGGPNKTLLLTTGVEATENAVKIARAATNRPGVVAFHGGFHGRTLLGLALTASSTGYRQNFGPFAPEVYHAPFPYEYRGIGTARGAGGAAVPVRLADRARRRWPRSSSSRSWARAGSCRRRWSSCASCGACAPPTASCSSPTRSRPASAAPAGCSPTSTTASSPTW